MLLFWLFILFGSASSAHADLFPVLERLGLSDHNFAVEFSHFAERFGKQYASDAEVALRLHIFSDNLILIDRWNVVANRSTVYGVTKFADWTWEEFSQNYLMKTLDTSVRLPRKSFGQDGANQLPESYDWRQYGIISHVREQGSCAGCYAFATVAVVESMAGLKNGVMENFSEQQIIDCSTYGCRGGAISNAFSFAENHGLPFEADYAYTEGSGPCQRNKTVQVQLGGSYQLVAEEEAMMYTLTLSGPFAVVFQVGPSFQHYVSGVVTSDDCETRTENWFYWHAMQVIGFGTRDGIPYWLSKNSWGTSWGEGGYSLTQRGTNWCKWTTQPIGGWI